MTDAEDRAMLELSYITPCDDAISGYESVKLLGDPAAMTNTQARAALIEIQESRRMMKRTLDRLEAVAGAAAVSAFTSEYDFMAAEISRRMEAGI